MLLRLVIRGLDLVARLPGCGFIGWALIGVSETDTKEARKCPRTSYKA